MKTAATHALETESAYLAGVGAKLGAAGGRLIPGRWFKREDHDDGDRVRAEMVDRRIYDRQRYAEMPHGRGFALRGFERRWLFGKRVKSVTIATVLAPPGPLLESDEPAPPVSLAELSAHLRALVSDTKTPHLIGVCSPSGFEEDVRSAPPEMSNVTLVLVEPKDGGGWRASSSDSRLDPRLLKLFDPEDVDQKLERVRREIENRSSDLLTGGLTAEAIAKDLDLPASLVESAFQQVARSDPELRVSGRAGEAMLYRGAPVLSDMEDASMSLSDKIKSLFSKEGDETQKINALAERRAALSGRLDRMYGDIAKLEKKENQIRAEGKAASAQVSKRRIASQISRLRKDISRCNTSASLLSKQINIISTHIHNLELARTGSVAQLPSGEELTEAAVSAEEMLEQLSASDDLVSSLEVGMAESAISDDEAAILRELEKDEEQKEPQSGETVPDRAVDTTPSQRRERGEAQAEE